ncbi:MAG: imidazolonepropionase [Bacteroidia bacterium]|nr:imidazolonepropionase [Bacteroidia bacterium]MBP7261727.1 imidazolonepropionase [Bacteroidia bacterium]MBP9180894.1 imidazolonepropionase [Bacteroidia bacterium]MBP9725410.1 imidazolonepropionase [Bacteroidia bacterium]
MNLLIKNIKQLIGVDEHKLLRRAGKEMKEMHVIENAFLYIENGKISSFGSMKNFDAIAVVNNHSTVTQVDATGRVVMPTFVDAHTHLVFAATREEEFVMRIKGMSYEEIAEKGGGILNSARRLQAMSEDELYEGARNRLLEVIKQGTGAIEIKSGYGLTVEDEIKMLRVIQRLKKVSPIPIKANFLGAHAFPLEYKQNRSGYIKLIIEEMLPRIVKEQLADYCDVFCDNGFFTPEETDRILKTASALGLKAKIHGNELGYSGGVQVAVKNNALSVDHLEYCGEEEIDCLKNSSTMPMALPGCSFFLGIPFAPVRKMIDAGLPVCLASDYNPGSSPSGRMSFVLSLACTRMHLTPEEAIHATTINGAAAIELAHSHGSIATGKAGSVIITKPIPSYNFIPYNFGSDCIEHLVINGELIV